MSTPTVIRQFIDGRHGQIHVRLCAAVEQADTHRPLYCLHMSPKSGRSFARLMPFVGNHRTVVAPDYPGYGESTAPPAEPYVTVEDYAASVWEVADALGHEKIDLLGHHTGSFVATAMAHASPDRVGRIIMIAAPVLLAEEIDQFHQAYAPLPLDEEGSRFRIMWQRVVQHRGPGQTAEMMAESFAENLRGGENYEWGHRAAFSYANHFCEQVSALQHQITVLNPADDLQQHTLRVVPHLQHGNLIDCPDWGHGFLDAYSSDVAALIEAYL